MKTSAKAKSVGRPLSSTIGFWSVNSSSLKTLSSATDADLSSSTVGLTVSTATAALSDTTRALPSRSLTVPRTLTTRDSSLLSVATDNSEESLVVSVLGTVKDLEGNALVVSESAAVAVDTVNPTVELDRSASVAEDNVFSEDELTDQKPIVELSGLPTDFALAEVFMIGANADIVNADELASGVS